MKSEASSSQNARANPERKRLTSKSRPRKGYTAHEATHDSEPESDDQTLQVMSIVTRNGPAFLRLRRRFREILEQDDVEIDPDCFKCILRFERKKKCGPIPMPTSTHMRTVLVCVEG